MHESITPVCPETSLLAQLFCCEPSCGLPAFACSVECLSSHPHQEHRGWEQVEPSLRRAMELPLEGKDVETLEQQNKQIKILVGQLTVLQQDHWRTLGKCR